MFSALGPTQLASTLLDSTLAVWLICSTRKPIKIVHARKKCQRNKSSAPTSNAPMQCGIFNAHQGVLCRSVWSHCPTGANGSVALRAAASASRSCWWVTKYFINVLSHFSRATFPQTAARYLCICVYVRARIFVSVAVAVLYACSSWWGFVLIKCLFALLFKLVSFHSASVSVSVSTVLSLSMSVCFCPDILSCLFCRRIMIITNFRSFLNLRAAVNNFVN